MHIQDVATKVALTALTYLIASWANASYDPMKWGVLTLIIAGIVAWNVWDPDED